MRLRHTPALILLASVALPALAAPFAPSPAPSQMSDEEMVKIIGTPPEASATRWILDGQLALRRARGWFPGLPERAKNVILFVGDGMDITTITAARIYEAQLRGESGESNTLGFERFPHMALAHTYSLDRQAPDSAAAMSALVTGVKTHDGVLSLDGSVSPGDTAREKVEAAARLTLLELAERSGLATGVVSTARITHATPAATYAHSSNRDWESDVDLPAGSQVPDIASQLVDRFGEGGIGDGIDVILGGGRAKFLPKGAGGERADGRNLVEEWKRRTGGVYVQDRAGLKAIDYGKTRRALGLFADSHMAWDDERGDRPDGEPSLAHMTRKAIRILSTNPKGFVLVVEAGRIDHAHHEGYARRALTETIALSKAVTAAMDEVQLGDTLVIVTADHAHGLTMAGESARGTPVLGKVMEPGAKTSALAKDGAPWTTLAYATGPGTRGASGLRERLLAPARGASLADTDTTARDYRQEALVPLESGAHSAVDVPVFAAGPGSQFVYSSQEQSYFFYVMRAALGL